MYSSAVLWGSVHGTGKTLVGYTMKRIYGDNAKEIRDHDLQGSFNDWAEARQFVIGDEITGDDKRSHANKLKGLITQAEVSVNKKYVPAYTIKDCINYLFTSQGGDAFFLEDSDRRFFVHEVEAEPMKDEFYTRYDRWYKSDEVGALFHHLLQVDLTGFNPNSRAMETKAKHDMIVHSRSDVSTWAHALLDDPETTLQLMGATAAKECDLYTPAQLLACYQHQGDRRQVTANGLGRELRRCRVKHVNGGHLVRTNHGVLRLYAVRNGAKWDKATPAEITEHFNKYFEKTTGGKF
jgi:hypothetical protein